MSLESIFYTHLREVVNKSWNYAGRCQTPQDHIMNAALGLAGETGEVMDVLKKSHFHGIVQDHDNFYREKIKKELGDVNFYWLKLVDLFGFSHEEIIAMNKAKLESRHPELGKVTERFGEGYIK